MEYNGGGGRVEVVEELLGRGYYRTTYNNSCFVFMGCLILNPIQQRSEEETSTTTKNHHSSEFWGICAQFQRDAHLRRLEKSLKATNRQ